MNLVFIFRKSGLPFEERKVDLLKGEHMRIKVIECILKNYLSRKPRKGVYP